jgi:linoleoyl-CoA desaturase
MKFGVTDGFHVELRRRVDAFFRTTGRRPRDCWQIYVKTGILVAVGVASYLLLVLGARTWWQALPLAILLGLAAAGIGFNVQHDGGHRAYSRHSWINDLMAMTLDLIGGSSYVWNCKHAILHHTYVNITNHDADINLGVLARLAPFQKRFWFHRWQHVYLWPLYGLLAIKPTFRRSRPRFPPPPLGSVHVFRKAFGEIPRKARSLRCNGVSSGSNR